METDEELLMSLLYADGSGEIIHPSKGAIETENKDLQPASLLNISQDNFYSCKSGPPMPTTALRPNLNRLVTIPNRKRVWGDDKENIVALKKPNQESQRNASASIEQPRENSHGKMQFSTLFLTIPELSLKRPVSASFQETLKNDLRARYITSVEQVLGKTLTPLPSLDDTNQSYESYAIFGIVWRHATLPASLERGSEQKQKGISFEIIDLHAKSTWHRKISKTQNDSYLDDQPAIVLNIAGQCLKERDSFKTGDVICVLDAKIIKSKLNRKSKNLDDLLDDKVSVERTFPLTYIQVTGVGRLVYLGESSHVQKCGQPLSADVEKENGPVDKSKPRYCSNPVNGVFGTTRCKQHLKSFLQNTLSTRRPELNLALSPEIRCYSKAEVALGLTHQARTISKYDRRARSGTVAYIPKPPKTVQSEALLFENSRKFGNGNGAKCYQMTKQKECAKAMELQEKKLLAHAKKSLDESLKGNQNDVMTLSDDEEDNDETAKDS